MKDTKVPLAGRIKYFSQSWKKITQDQEILNIVEEYKIPFFQIPTQKRTPRQTHVLGTKIVSRTRDFGNVGEGSHPESKSKSREISKQFIPCQQEGWRESLCSKF